MTRSEQMNIVIVGHVDHGKSTLIGRLLADTNSLPEGKLEQVKLTCERNSKPFEYAFLLDALKDEQAQGITIDTARSFFKSQKRDYIIIDAPGHIEFLKNMITGAARAEAALLLIDAKEGIQENSRRHGFMLSLLGIKKVVVLVNKMDLVHYDQAVFEKIKTDYQKFLSEIGVVPKAFIPIAAREGDLLIGPSAHLPWYTGLSVLDQMDAFEKDQSDSHLPFRFPVQDIYKFTEKNDDRRIVAGTVATGQVSVGDEVTFWPSGKKSTIASIEEFNAPTLTTTNPGKAAGFTLSTQIYVKPGELMCKTSDDQPLVAATFKASLFWMGKSPMLMGKKYKLKIGTSRAIVELQSIISVMNAAELTHTQKKEIERHEVANCILQTLKPIACDLSSDCAQTGRFVIVDDYEIAGGGIITEVLADRPSLIADRVAKRDQTWEKSAIITDDRASTYGHKPKFIVLTGDSDAPLVQIAKALEEYLFLAKKNVYFLGITNVGSPQDLFSAAQNREDFIYRLGETAHLFTEAGMLLISTVFNLDDSEADILKILNSPHDILVISLGENSLEKFPVAGVLNPKISISEAVSSITNMLIQRDVLIEYFL